AQTSRWIPMRNSWLDSSVCTLYRRSFGKCRQQTSRRRNANSDNESSYTTPCLVGTRGWYLEICSSVEISRNFPGRLLGKFCNASRSASPRLECKRVEKSMEVFMEEHHRCHLRQLSARFGFWSLVQLQFLRSFLERAALGAPLAD